MQNLKFIDLTKEANLKNGIEYFAVGLVVECHMENGVPTPSGKDYAVEYIDPFGSYHLDWRASGEIDLSPISAADFEHLKTCYEDAKNR